jgi:hypothetical protein
MRNPRAALHLDLFEQPGRKRVFQHPAERAEVGAAAGKLLPMPLPGGALEEAAIAAAGCALRAQVS